MKLTIPERKVLEEHYTKDEAMQTETGERTIAVWKSKGKEVTETPLEIGNRIREWNISALEGKPVIAMVFEGFHAVEVGRKIVGHTEPRQALPGTIRGDFSAESYCMNIPVLCFCQSIVRPPRPYIYQEPCHKTKGNKTSHLRKKSREIYA